MMTIKRRRRLLIVPIRFLFSHNLTSRRLLIDLGGRQNLSKNNGATFRIRREGGACLLVGDGITAAVALALAAAAAARTWPASSSSPRPAPVLEAEAPAEASRPRCHASWAGPPRPEPPSSSRFPLNYKELFFKKSNLESWEMNFGKEESF